MRRQLRRFDALEESPPQEVPLPQGGETALLPIWVTVNIPHGTISGQYEGLLKVKADGMAETTVLIRLEVGDVTVPELAKQISYAGIVQSPDTLVLKYGVKRWSAEHWKLIERSFRQIGKIGGDCVVIPLVRRTFYGNEESMVRWIRGKDGILRHDLKIMERYLDCAIKQSGPTRIICLCVWEPVNAYSDPGPEGKGMKMEASIQDETTGEVGAIPVPEWGTTECVTFWKPVFDDIKKMLAARGVERAMCVGTCAQASPGKVVLNDMETISPGIKWYALRHEWWDKVGQRETAVSIGVYGNPGRVGPR